jgi:hypothetical protein
LAPSASPDCQATVPAGDPYVITTAGLAIVVWAAMGAVAGEAAVVGGLVAEAVGWTVDGVKGWDVEVVDETTIVTDLLELMINVMATAATATIETTMMINRLLSAIFVITL